MVCPGPSLRATRTAAEQFNPDELVTFEKNEKKEKALKEAEA